MNDTEKNTEEEIRSEESSVNKNDEAEKDKKEKKKRSPMVPIQTFFLNALLILTAIWLLCGFILGFTTVPNGDMTPNFKTGDLLMYYQLNRDFVAQDVVVLKKNDTTYIGRVVAKGGDTVNITDKGGLVINGNTMIETNIYNGTVRYEGFVNYPVTLKDGEYFVLNDIRSSGEDSRYYGPVSESEILGKVITAVRRNNL
ncbi:MAG: signal peptidase I [Ruminococcus sp.]|nr:signal peptidase I [Ruminococcus sp.]